MYLTFPHADLVSLQEDADANWPNGIRELHGNREPGFWIVGDQGVYLLSNAERPGDEYTPFICYAAEANPHTCPDFWEVKRDTWGGDDGVEFLDASTITQAIESGCDLRVAFEEDVIAYHLDAPTPQAAE